MNNKSVLTIGNFDGIHIGHRKLLNRLTDIAANNLLNSVVITFEDHPAFTLNLAATPKLLCPPLLKARELNALGVNDVAMLQFTPELAHQTALQFLRDYIVPTWKPEIILMGYDSHFGFNRQGNYEFLSKVAPDFGFHVEFVPPLLAGDKPVSSSMIRNLLLQGSINEANSLLGKPYRLTGEVAKGIGKGTGFGFPTANLQLSTPHQLIPKDGIYFSKVHLEHASFFGLTNIGSSPTVKHTGIVEIETFILDFSGDIYGYPIELELLQYLREEKVFKNENELIFAMQQDLSKAKELISAEAGA
jgi:riboflavin kinase/FMN adenylyltransferase